jgi:hypothetical protein
MKTYSANAIAETFERDRGVVVRALRNTVPDAVVSGKPQWKIATASRALERHNRANDCRNSVQGDGRLCEIADELERLGGELDATIAKIKSAPDMDRKQPHSRAAVKMIQRLDRLYDEGNELKSKIEPGSPWAFVTPQITGALFRIVLAAVYGPKVEIDGERMFTDDQIIQFKLA